MDNPLFPDGDADPVPPKARRKIVLMGIGSHGDIQPMLALGRALRGRGHDVVLAAGDNYAPAAAKADLGFHANGSSVQKMVEQGGEAVFKPRTFVGILKTLAPEQLDETAKAAVGADVVVGSPAAFVGPTVAELVGARFAWAAYAPGTFPTSEAPFLIAGTDPRRRWLNRLTHTLGHAVAGRTLLQIMNPLRAARGLKPIADYTRHITHGVSVLYAVDEAFGRPPADWCVHARQTGFWFYDDDVAFPAELEAFLNAGPPPVYIGFGSMPANDAAARTRAIVDGAVKSGQRALISAGWGKLGDGDLPSSVLRIGGVSHARLFPRCAAVVHHCGAGTTSAASLAGVPQVPVPHAFDQPSWRDRLLELGVANAPLSRSFNGEQLAGAIKKTLADPALRERARALGERLRTTNGAAQAAVAVEDLGAAGASG